jgi:hypothetical protein
VAHVEARAQVGLDDAVPLIEGHAVQRAVPGDAGVVDEDIHRTEIGHDLLHPLGALFVVRDVELVRGDIGLAGEAFGRFVVTGVGRRHLVSGVPQAHGNGFADAAGSTCHNCYA